MQTEQFAVLGAGLMGVGIATHFARFGHDIWLYDTEQSVGIAIPISWTIFGK